MIPTSFHHRKGMTDLCPYILSFLDPNSFISISKTDRSMHRYANQPRLWRAIVAQQLPSTPLPLSGDYKNIYKTAFKTLTIFNHHKSLTFFPENTSVPLFSPDLIHRVKTTPLLEYKLAAIAHYLNETLFPCGTDSWRAVEIFANPKFEIGYLTIVLELGADPNLICRPSDGLNTALHQAAYHGNRQAINLLLSYGANPSIPNIYGEPYSNILKPISWRCLIS
jgi:hypothetical protein